MSRPSITAVQSWGVTSVREAVEPLVLFPAFVCTAVYYYAAEIHKKCIDPTVGTFNCCSMDVKSAVPLHYLTNK